MSFKVGVLVWDASDEDDSTKEVVVRSVGISFDTTWERMYSGEAHHHKSNKLYGLSVYSDIFNKPEDLIRES